jgi:hypothetical protein
LDKHVRLLLLDHRVKCHGATKQADGLRLEGRYDRLSMKTNAGNLVHYNLDFVSDSHNGLRLDKHCQLLASAKTA